MISGMYLGELVRIVLETLTREGHMFDGEYESIQQKGCFPTKYVSEIEAEMLEDDESQFTKTQVSNQHAFQRPTGGNSNNKINLW